MLIEEMNSEACLDLLSRTRLGRLACAQGLQPYVVPIFYAYQDYYLYSFTTVGQKIEWMRANPLVCVEVDEVVTMEKWSSVIVFGTYEEVPDTPERRAERELAWRLLQQYSTWWQPALAQRNFGPAEPRIPVFYRVSVTRMTGRRGIPDQRAQSESSRLTKKSSHRGWLGKLGRLVGG